MKYKKEIVVNCEEITVFDLIGLQLITMHAEGERSEEILIELAKIASGPLMGVYDEG